MPYRHLLLVEDSADLSALMKRLLEMEDFHVDCADNGQAALDWLRTSARLPELILLDMMMPILDGTAFRAEQTRDPYLSDIPVVLLSASAKIASDALRIGAQAFLPKPIDVDELLKIIHANLPPLADGVALV